MTQTVKGNLKGLKPSEIRAVEKLYRRRVLPEELGSFDLFREIYQLSENISRRVGVLISREGRIEEVFVGSREILYLPDLGRYRLGPGRLRRLRLIFGDLSPNRSEPVIPQDVYTDLEKLRLDAVVSVKENRSVLQICYAHLLPNYNAKRAEPVESKLGSQKLKSSTPIVEAAVETVLVPDVGQFEFNFLEFIENLEGELTSTSWSKDQSQKREQKGAVLIGVYDRRVSDVASRMVELKNLADTAGVPVLDVLVQRQPPNPKTLLGKGKLEEVALHCLRLGAELLIFDTELRPSQWRAIANATELKVIDRSMLILDIFAQRAQSAAGRIQVELAQLKYNMPRLVELDAGLSRLVGGIGGRGPGETKLEIGRRRARDRITRLERQLEDVSKHRQLRSKRANEGGVPTVAIIGYTNVGKSTLMNRLTGSGVLAEDKLFATLEPAKRRLVVNRELLLSKEASELVLEEGAIADCKNDEELSDSASESQTVFQEGPAKASSDDLECAEPAERADQRVIERGDHGLCTILISDTVGFIRELPKELVAAFRSTLEELHQADLLLHVVDGSDDSVEQQKRAVDLVLEEMSLADKPVKMVVNKIDATDPAIARGLVKQWDALAVSGLSGVGSEKLALYLADYFYRSGKRSC